MSSRCYDHQRRGIVVAKGDGIYGCNFVERDYSRRPLRCSPTRGMFLCEVPLSKMSRQVMKMMDGSWNQLMADGGWRVWYVKWSLSSSYPSSYHSSNRLSSDQHGACSLRLGRSSPRETATLFASDHISHARSRHDRIIPGTTRRSRQQRGDRILRHVARWNLHPILPLLIAER